MKNVINSYIFWNSEAFTSSICIAKIIMLGYCVVVTLLIYLVPDIFAPTVVIIFTIGVSELESFIEGDSLYGEEQWKASNKCSQNPDSRWNWSCLLSLIDHLFFCLAEGRRNITTEDGLHSWDQNSGTRFYMKDHGMTGQINNVSKCLYYYGN